MGVNKKFRPPAKLQTAFISEVDELMEKMISQGGLTNRFSIRGFGTELMFRGYYKQKSEIAKLKKKIKDLKNKPPVIYNPHNIK